MHDFPIGVVERDGDRYIGVCHDVGTTSVGHTVEEAFANLRAATWQYIQRQHEHSRMIENQGTGRDFGAILLGSHR